MRVCIIGGGLTGLAAAFALAKDCRIDLYEKRSALGGCLSSYRIDNFTIEEYYHHCFSGDTELFSLLRTLGLFDRLEWRSASTGYYAGGKIYPLTTPLEILRYPYLSITDKAKLAFLTLRAKSMDAQELDTVPAEEFVKKQLGEGIYTSFFEPLLNSKFGGSRKDVSAAWLVSRIAIRSDRGAGGERLGYLRGGFSCLIDALADSVRKDGGMIHERAAATAIRRDGAGWDVNGQHYDTVLSTIPPQELSRIGGPEMDPVPYQGAACTTIGLDGPVNDGIYWLNMKDPAPYGAVVAHTNFIPRERYGCSIVYLASYFSGNLPANTDTVMTADFCRRFSVPESAIRWKRVAVDPFAGPVYTLGYRSRIPAYENAGLFAAGMFSEPNYPERSMEGSIRAGLTVAERIRAVHAGG